MQQEDNLIQNDIIIKVHARRFLRRNVETGEFYIEKVIFNDKTESWKPES